MSDRMTSISLPGVQYFGSLAEYGRKTVPEMVAQIRRRAERMKVEAEAILAANDEDFTVATYVGAFAHRNYEKLQDGRAFSGDEAPAVRPVSGTPAHD